MNPKPDPYHTDIPHYLSKRNERIKRVGEAINTEVLPQVLKRASLGLHLEIGCGHGHWLTSFALGRPDHVFVGIDLLSKRIRKSQAKKNNLMIENVFFMKAEASEFLQSIPANLKILSTTFMFPDPWPKKRHFKKRIIQSEFLELLATVSSYQSKIFFRTDHLGYFNWTTNLLHRSSSWEMSDEAWPCETNSFFQNLFEFSHTCSAARV